MGQYATNATSVAAAAHLKQVLGDKGSKIVLPPEAANTSSGMKVPQ
jgi:hypothetical protein